MNTDTTILHLSLIDGIGPRTIKKMLHKTTHDFDLTDVYQLKENDFIHTFGVSKSIASKLYIGLSDKRAVEKEIALLERHQIQLVSIADKTYPTLLANIYAPPVVLYIKGTNILDNEKNIAFVGSRKAHRYGERVIEQMIPDMVNAGCTIVSGGAIGADSMSHRATVRARGKTISVLGSGLLHPYPFSNRNLFADIVASGGALISAFPLQTVAKPGNFPARNRIIAGLSLGCVVVQAAQKSGASITAQFALDEGREVFAVPGPIDDELSQGCHFLIQQGAKLVGNSHDILCELGTVIPEKQGTIFSNETKSHSQDKKNKCTAVKTNVSLNPAKTCEYDETSIEGKILKYCLHPSSPDEIAMHTDIDLQELHEILFDLQVSGKLKQNHAGMFERV